MILDISRNDDTATTADAGQINRGGIRTADVSVTNYTTLFTDSTTLIVWWIADDPVWVDDERKADVSRKRQKCQSDSGVIANPTIWPRIGEFRNEPSSWGMNQENTGRIDANWRSEVVESRTLIQALSQPSCLANASYIRIL